MQNEGDEHPDCPAETAEFRSQPDPDDAANRGECPVDLPCPTVRTVTTSREATAALVSEATASPPDARFGQPVRYVPIVRRLLADTLTPVTAYAALARGTAATGDTTVSPPDGSHEQREEDTTLVRQAATGRGTFLFESVVSNENVGRYSFLGIDPTFRVEAYGPRLDRHDLRTGERTSETPDDLLDTLDALLAQHRALPHAHLPRFAGGAVGYFAYDSVRYVEHLPNAPQDDRNLPDLSLGFYERMVIFDHINKVLLLVAQLDLRAVADEGLDAEYDRAVADLDSLQQRLFAAPALPQATAIHPAGDVTLDWTSNFTREQFEAAVERGKEYIRAGDVFQFVPSQRLTVQTDASPLGIYRALRVINPSPFMFLLDLPDVQLIGASPEIMTRVDDGEVTVRPLAGTRPRGRTEEEDRRLEADLLADEKERAEHVMLVDLARNDIGRVARYGSVDLTDVMSVERYSHVMHISSNVVGRMREGLTALDAMRATLPAGTVSGAPKVRAMEIIDELEPHRRGPYGGAVGYIDFTGDMDLCIALRTMVMRDRTCWVQAGCGVVADSDPAAEWQETINKAKGLLKAIEVAGRDIEPREPATAQGREAPAS